MVEIYNSIKVLFTLTVVFLVISYYGFEFLTSFLERKFKIHVGSIGFLSIVNLSYSGNVPGPQRTQHSFKISVNKLHLQIRRPNLNRKTWLTKGSRKTITTVPQKAWWSFILVIK